MSYFGPPDLFAEADEIYIIVTFTADKPKAEALAEDWKWVAPVTIGCVAYGDLLPRTSRARCLQDAFATRSSGRIHGRHTGEDTYRLAGWALG